MLHWYNNTAMRINTKYYFTIQITPGRFSAFLCPEIHQNGFFWSNSYLVLGLEALEPFLCRVQGISHIPHCHYSLHSRHIHTTMFLIVIRSWMCLNNNLYANTWYLNWPHFAVTMHTFHRIYLQKWHLLVYTVHSMCLFTAPSSIFEPLHLVLFYISDVISSTNCHP